MAERGIGVAVSGGGHRAALFGLGALMYLADSGMNREVTSIASVSGGGMTNGYAAQEVDFTTVSGPEFEAAMRPLASRIAQRGTVFASWMTWAFLLVALVVLVGVVAVWFVSWPIWARIGAFTIGLLLLGWWVGLRSHLCELVFRSQLYSKEGKPTLLRQINTKIDHVFCVTDLHAGEHVYFSGRFVCAYRFGWGSPNETPLSFAVQAAAALPGAFSPRWPRTKPFGFQLPQDPKAATTQRMTLVDGGVYDNMADQWTQRVQTRNKRWRDLHPNLNVPTEAIVVNASAGLTFGSTALLGVPIVGEILGLKRDESVLYDNGTSVRRRMLIDRFRQAQESGRDLDGCLVHIADSPFVVPDSFATGKGPGRDRALDVIAHLGDTRKEWDARAERTPAVKTNLSKLGTDDAADLLFHAYVLAMANLHVVLGYPLLAMPSRDRFVQMVSGSSMHPATARLP
jgi:hypothetical protein